MSKRVIEKVLLEVKLEELEKELKEANHKIRDLQVLVNDLGGCACPKCLAGWGGKGKRSRDY